MDNEAVDFLWQIVSAGMGTNTDLLEELADQFFSNDFDIPGYVDKSIAQFFIEKDEHSFNKAACCLAENFVFSTPQPKRHLSLVAALLRKNALSPLEAARLVRLDPSNISLLDDEGQEIVRVAEILGEDGALEAEVDRVTELLMEYHSRAK